MKYRYQLLLALIFFNSYAQQSYIDYVSPFHPIESSSGMVVSQNELSSQLGTEILNKGGNAVDAAVGLGFLWL